MNINEMILKQIQESEEETLNLNLDDAQDNISDILARQKQQERGFKI